MIKTINRENLFDRLIGIDNVSIDVYFRDDVELGGYLIFDDKLDKFGIEVSVILRGYQPASLRKNLESFGKPVVYFEGGEKIFFNDERELVVYKLGS